MKSAEPETFTPPGDPDVRPWYREPWPWVLIAIPLLTIIASAYTFYLAVSHPDYLVVDEEEYNAIVEELRAEPSLGPERSPEEPDGENAQR
jgi:hypothetical protein